MSLREILSAAPQNSLWKYFSLFAAVIEVGVGWYNVEHVLTIYTDFRAKDSRKNAVWQYTLYINNKYLSTQSNSFKVLHILHTWNNNFCT